MPYRLYTPEASKNAYKKMLKQMNPTDIVWAFDEEKQKCRSYSNDDFRFYMLAWRQMAKCGYVRIEEFNDRTKTIDGKEWHFLVVQTTDPKDTAIDPMGCSLYGFTVSGTIYSFQNKDNRDKVRQYVMKNIN